MTIKEALKILQLTEDKAKKMTVPQLISHTAKVRLKASTDDTEKISLASALVKDFITQNNTKPATKPKQQEKLNTQQNAPEKSIKLEQVKLSIKDIPKVSSIIPIEYGNGKKANIRLHRNTIVGDNIYYKKDNTLIAVSVVS